jgi:hypothetical protein
VINTHASNAVVKARPSITLSRVLLVAVMRNGIFNAFAQHAIIRKVVGFLVRL